MELLFAAGIGLATITTTFTAAHFSAKRMERKGSSKFAVHQRKAKRGAKR